MFRAERPLVVIVACHLLASFAVLGMAPYFGTILAGSFGKRDPFWTGTVYSVPLLAMAVASPLWGRFADRFGKRLSLARAQLGLMIALFACGCAPSALSFAGCLLLQGVFGGTFSASNALLTEYYRGPRLARALSFLQYSACFGLFAAPSVLGAALTRMPNPQQAYFGLCLLPLASFLCLQRALPARPATLWGDEPQVESVQRHTLPFRTLLWMEFGFTVSTVVTYPHFVRYFASLPGIRPELSGLFFGMPHAVYLLLGVWAIREARGSELARVTGAFVLFTGSMVLHLFSWGPVPLVAARLCMGAALLFGYVYLARLVSRAVRPASAGAAFGWLDTASKFAGVLAGVLAGSLVQTFGTRGPFALAAVGGVILTVAALDLLWKEQRLASCC